MKKELLLKYIKGEATSHEEIEIYDWIGKSPDNKRYFVILNNLWISQNISQDKANEREIEEIRELTTKRGNLFKRYGKYISYAAVAVVVLSLSLNLFLLDSNNKLVRKFNDTPVRLSELSRDYKHEIYTEKGVKAKITLPDGSAVWLNSDSRIIYPDRFESDIREIEFSGEAYFDVVTDSLRPLIIKTNKDFKIEVLGTQFNVRSYDNDNEAQTTLYSGSLNVVSKGVSSKPGEVKEIVTTLKPSESCIIRAKQNPIHIKQADANKQYAWKDGKIIFDSTPLSEVIKMLERWHGTEFVVKDPSIYRFDITAKFRSESIVQIMEMIKYCSLVDYTVDSNKVVLYRR
ncbi:MAG: FecR domain-containing protein [Bacteroidales bacterium]|nr:FecR domain-containing protein [Bacteroidales bacterium]